MCSAFLVQFWIPLDRLSQTPALQWTRALLSALRCKHAYRLYLAYILCPPRRPCLRSRAWAVLSPRLQAYAPQAAPQIALSLPGEHI